LSRNLVNVNMCTGNSERDSVSNMAAKLPSIESVYNLVKKSSPSTSCRPGRDVSRTVTNPTTTTNTSHPPVQVKKEKDDLDEFSNEELLLTLLDRNACFTCICGMMFKDLEMLCLHKRIHDPLDATYCSYCSRRFKTWKDFLEHIKDHSK
jgi:hypothetical protein